MKKKPNYLFYFILCLFGAFLCYAIIQELEMRAKDKIQEDKAIVKIVNGQLVLKSSID
jgi:uncharacterized membrane protein